MRKVAGIALAVLLLSVGNAWAEGDHGNNDERLFVQAPPAPKGQVQAPATIKICAAPTANLTASNTNITIGDSVTLTWTTTNAATLTLASSDGSFASQGLTPVAGGSITVTPFNGNNAAFTTAAGANPTANVTYTITAKNACTP